MRRNRKSQKKSSKRIGKRTRTFKRSRFPPRRSVVMRGGNGSSIFSSSFSNSDVAASPQSYLPFNNYSNDPGYSVIASRNTGDFLTGVLTGGRRNRKRGTKSKKIYGGSDVSTTMSNGLNSATNSVGIMQSPALNETSGVSGVLSQFSGTGSAYSSMPVNMARLA